MTIEKEQLEKQNSSLESEALKELKIHQEAVKDSSLLSLIREKEVGLKKKVIETQIQADKIVSEAEKEAEKMAPKIETEARKRAQDYYQKELAKIQQEAKKIVQEAPAKIKEVEQIGKQNFDKAINKLTELLIPKG